MTWKLTNIRIQVNFSCVWWPQPWQHHYACLLIWSKTPLHISSPCTIWLYWMSSHSQNGWGAFRAWQNWTEIKKLISQKERKARCHKASRTLKQMLLTWICEKENWFRISWGMKYWVLFHPLKPLSYTQTTFDFWTLIWYQERQNRKTWPKNL